jgi:tetratricopeptide (TPR) repeat protein
MSNGEVILIEEAYRLFEKAIDISNKTDGPSFYNIGNANRLLGKIPAAIKEYGNAIKYLKASEQFDAYVKRGVCYR